MTKVASIVSYPVMPAKMGGQKGIYLFLKYFSQQCDVICYTTKKNIPGPDEPFRTKKILSNRKLRYINPAYFFKLKKDFKKEQITHLIIEHPYFGWLGILLKWFSKVRLTVHSHNIESLRFRDMEKWWWQILWWYEKIVYRLADTVFFISEEDREYALFHFNIPKEKSIVITYGTEHSKTPSTAEITAARQKINNDHSIDPGDIILLYNGTLDYKPNLAGLDLILQEINPLVQLQQNYKFTIVICGSRLPASYDNLSGFKKQKIVYAGFVENIRDYFLAADVFINPIIDGGGIKTKLVEALAANCSSASFSNGAIGIPTVLTGNKLFIAADNTATSFLKSIKRAVETRQDILPTAFFDHFYWGNIVQKAISFIQ